MTRHDPPAVRHACLAALFAATALAGSVAGSVAAPQGEGEGEGESEQRGFSIYDTQGARALAQSAEEHVRGGRIVEAVRDLQALIEEHRGEVLGASRPERAGRPSQQDVHRGASDHALRRLFELGPEAQSAYRSRYGERARAALTDAVARADRAALVDLARRYPLTEAAERAWWALGDLEIELGNLEDGARAWSRALAFGVGRPDAQPTDARAFDALLEEYAGRREPAAAAARARAELAKSVLGPRADERQGLLGNGRIGGTALEAPIADVKLPGRDTDTWQQAFELPWHPFDVTGGRYNLYPAQLGDTIFVSTSLEVLAIGAFTGSLAWRSGEDLLGWREVTRRDEHYEGVDLASTIVAPAAARGVVVAALQIPLSLEPKIDYGDMPIIRPLPNRRLFAFDAATGRLLWDTRPPPLWDGSSGSFSDRMRVVGPPVIAGSRVLVPAARLEGRIEYHVGCYDLYTGELLWSTAVITGQQALNMFGRFEVEFAAPPLEVAENRVLALTQLGSLAALDLFTGDVQWQVIYDQIPLPPTRHFRPGPRDTVWRNTPPVVTGDTVLATPHDSTDLIAVDLASGHMIWSLGHYSLLRDAPPKSDLDLLFGADEHHVYLAGNRVVALRSPSGVSRGPVASHTWAFPVGDTISLRSPRPVLGHERLYVPDLKGIYAVDRATGRRLEEIAWGGSAPGNLLVGEGMLFALGPRRLDGYFEWEKLVERARSERASDPEEVGRVLTLAVLLEKRGVAEWRRGNAREAERHLAEARRVLESLVQPGLAETHPAILAELHHVLRAEARAAQDLADPARALELLGHARTIAPSDATLRDSLLEEAALLRSRDRGRWLTALGVLLEECAEMPLTVEARPTGERRRPWSGPLLPASDTGGGPGLASLEIPVGLWVLLERAETYRMTDRAAEEFADLHAILERYPDVRLFDVPASEVAAARIAAKLAAGERAGHEAFEARARELFERAVDGADTESLRRVVGLYPHTRAAHEASDTLLRWALETRDERASTAIVLGELGESFRMGTASPRQVENLVALAWVYGEKGNPALRSGLAESLARTHAATEVALPDGEVASVGELAERWRLPVPVRAEAEASFTSAVRSAAPQQALWPGQYEPLGEVPALPGADRDVVRHLVVFADRGRVLAFADSDPSRPLWQLALPLADTPREWLGRFSATRGRAHLALPSSVLTVDRETGDPVWSFEAGPSLVESVVQSGGVVVVSLDSTPGERAERLIIALEASSGTELWRQSVAWREFVARPVAGEQRLALLPQHPHGRGEVRDLFTGARIAEFTLEVLYDRSARAAWVQDGRLIVPRLSQATQPEQNHVSAIDLENGREAWRVELASLRARELTEVLRHAGRTYLVTTPDDQRGSAAVFELYTDLGSASSRAVAELGVADRLVGIPPGATTELSTPYLFVLAEPRVTDGYTLRAVHLPYGTRWETPLAVSLAGLHTRIMPMPALSESTVAVAWQEPVLDRASPPTTNLVFFDRATGRRLEKRTLASGLTGPGNVQLLALGDALFLCGMKRLEVLR